jgi:hypothetical protein
MRRAILMSIIGLALAFGAFYVFSWPTTVSGSFGDELGFREATAGELLHSGLFDFKVAGHRDIEILTVKLNSPSPGLSLVSARVGLGGAGSIGSASGPQPAIDALPRAPGFVLHPRDDGAFVVSFQAVAPGTFTFSGITVVYQTGWLTRSVKLGPRVTVTVPEPSTTPSPNPTPS